MGPPGLLATQYVARPSGRRRHAATFSRIAIAMLGSNLGPRDYEQLDGVGLVHMNGRVYMPEIGRFLSPDPVMQFPSATQGLNRYTYVLNNPLSYTDPSGYSLLSTAINLVATAVVYAAAIEIMAVIEGANFVCAGICPMVVGSVSGSVVLTADYYIAAGTGSDFQPGQQIETSTWERSSGGASDRSSSLLERYRDEIGYRLAVDNVRASAASTNQSDYVDDVSAANGSSPYHEAAVLLWPGYDLGTCISNGQCGKADWIIGILGVIPGGKGFALGGKAALRWVNRAKGPPIPQRGLVGFSLSDIPLAMTGKRLCGPGIRRISR